MLTDMAALTFRFYDANGEWQNQWPPDDNIDEDFNLMPLAIEATVELETLGSVRRVFVLPN